MMATEQEVCPACGGDGAYATTNLDGLRARICSCVPADQPPPEMYDRIVAAIAAEQAGLRPDELALATAPSPVAEFGPEPARDWRGDSTATPKGVAVGLLLSVLSALIVVLVLVLAVS